MTPRTPCGSHHRNVRRPTVGNGAIGAPTPRRAGSPLRLELILNLRLAHFPLPRPPSPLCIYFATDGKYVGLTDPPQGREDQAARRHVARNARSLAHLAVSDPGCIATRSNPRATRRGRVAAGRARSAPRRATQRALSPDRPARYGGAPAQRRRTRRARRVGAKPSRSARHRSRPGHRARSPWPPGSTSRQRAAPPAASRPRGRLLQEPWPRAIDLAVQEL